MVNDKIYTVAPQKYKYPWQIIVLEKIVLESPIALLSGIKAFARASTQPIPYDVTAQKLEALLENQPAFGQVHVERTK